MLETMIYNPRPTRAEATDIANAVYDGTDCVMLSGETAKGDYPIQAVERMASICLTTEETLDYNALYNSLRKAVVDSKMKVSVSETIASSAVKTSEELEAALIIVLTETGNTARLISKYKPHVPTLVITQHKQTARQLMCTRGVSCRLVDSIMGADGIIKMITKDEIKRGTIKVGDVCVLVFGNIEGISGQTNNMKVITIQ